MCDREQLNFIITLSPMVFFIVFFTTGTKGSGLIVAEWRTSLVGLTALWYKKNDKSWLNLSDNCVPCPHPSPPRGLGEAGDKSISAFKNEKLSGLFKHSVEPHGLVLFYRWAPTSCVRKDGWGRKSSQPGTASCPGTGVRTGRQSGPTWRHRSVSVSVHLKTGMFCCAHLSSLSLCF